MFMSEVEPRDAAAADFTAVLRQNGKRHFRQAPIARLFGLDIVRWTQSETANEIVEMAEAGECATIQFVNAHCINTLRKDDGYRAALGAADFILPDGSGLAIAAKLSGQRIGENLNGTDLFPAICEVASRSEISLYLLGGAPGVATAAASAMQQRFPTLKIAGCRNGYWSDHEEQELIEEINRCGVGIVLVGLGVPRQEKWISRVRREIQAPIVMGVGGLFDYYSGRIARAPKLFRAVGCEWLWRLMLEPRRLFKRYVLGNPEFLVRAAFDALRFRRIAERLSLAIKRYFDMFAIVASLPIIAPLFLVIALAIKLDDRGPVYFSQTRVGMNGIPFRMLKFRSMSVDAEARLAAIRDQSDRDNVCFKMRDDPRVTRIGRVLRRLSLDELPQLLNVFRGQMSLVGPRPALPREVTEYSEADFERLRGIPGLTCSWQVAGRATIPFEQQVVLDKEYLVQRTLIGDILLLLRTIPAVISGRGAY